MSIDRIMTVSFIKSTAYSFLVALCVVSLACVPLSVEAEESSGGQSDTATTLLVLASGTYQGVWRDEAGANNALLLELNVDGDSVRGELTLIGVEDYSGDRIRGSLEQNDDGSVSVEFRTRDGMWRAKGIFDGQLLVGTYRYEFQDGRIQKVVRGEWAAQRAQ